MKQKDKSVFNIDAHSVLQKILSVVKLISNQQKCRTHYYYEHGKDHVLDFIEENPNQAHMTARGKGVKNGNYICIQSKIRNSTDQRYQVKKIFFYANPSDTFFALVEKVTDSTCGE